MAEPFSITVACVGIVANVGKASTTIAKFVHKYREAKHDMGMIHRELGTLKLVLQVMAQDTADGKAQDLPDSLSQQILGMLKECDRIIVEIMDKLSKYTGEGILAKSQWAMNGREEMDKLRSSLAAHASALGIALDMVTMYVSGQIRAQR
jgi:Fungal N-terminal domain of STAND proteins